MKIPNLPSKKVLTLEAAKKIASNAFAEAHRNNWHMAIAIVDDGAHLLYLERMDTTQIASVAVAHEKAATAVRFKRSSKVLEDAVTAGRQVVMTLPGATPIEGGLPIMVDGEVIGGIGVSGGTSTQDGAVAAAGLADLT
jgi:uncharacterized protein GlcG (DUF336 family)